VFDDNRWVGGGVITVENYNKDDRNVKVKESGEWTGEKFNGERSCNNLSVFELRWGIKFESLELF
jgi:hypothetical protein